MLPNTSYFELYQNAVHRQCLLFKLKKKMKTIQIENRRYKREATKTELISILIICRLVKKELNDRPMRTVKDSNSDKKNFHKFNPFILSNFSGFFFPLPSFSTSCCFFFSFNNCFRTAFPIRPYNEVAERKKKKVATKNKKRISVTTIISL